MRGLLELADGHALAVLVHMAEVAQTDALGNVRARGHGELERLLHVVAILVPLEQEGREGGGRDGEGRGDQGDPDEAVRLAAARRTVQSPAQTEDTSLMLNSRLAYQMSSPFEK